MAEIGILLIGVTTYLKKRKLETSEVFFLLSITFIAYADIIYLSTITIPGREAFISVICGEACYTLFVGSLLFFFILKFKKLLHGLTALIFLLATFIHLGASFYYVIMPFVNRDPSPILFHIINSSLYSILQAGIFGFTVAFAARINRHSEFLLTQLLLLLCISDFAIRYKIAFLHMTSMTGLEHGWHIAMAGSFFVILFNKNIPTFDVNCFSRIKSLRVILVAVASTVLILFLIFLGAIGFFSKLSMFSVIHVITTGFVIFLLANLFAMNFSNKMMAINIDILQSSFIALSYPNSQGMYRLEPANNKTAIEEIDRIIDKHNNLVEKFNKLIESSEQQMRINSLAEIASQVAHDVRSPLAALNMLVSGANVLPEEQRLVARRAVSRINDIANNLIDMNRRMSSSLKNQELTEATIEEPVVILISSLIDSSVTEKRLQFREALDVEIVTELTSDSYGIFASVQAVEFKRVLSNLLNNAVEALSTRGQVTVRLYGKEDQAVLEIQDNGKGIPEEIMEKIMVRGASFGKEKGSGLGLYHAKSRIESWGGKFELQSSVNVGTIVRLYLLKAPSPSWFVPVIELSENSTVVIIDDDRSIHGVWEGRFQNLRLFEYDIKVVHLSNPDEAKKWIQNEDNNASEHILYLCDYEFIGSRQNGLDLIEEFNIGSSSILVTSHYEEAEIRERCKDLGVKLIPKELAGFVPITIVPTTTPVSDAVLIDDDPLIHTVWQISAEQKGKTIKTFSSPEQFWSDINSFKLTVPIFIDSKLGSGIKGELVAKEIYEIGFKEIYLVTGYEQESFPEMYWIRNVMGKNPPW